MDMGIKVTSPLNTEVDSSEIFFSSIFIEQDIVREKICQIILYHFVSFFRTSFDHNRRGNKDWLQMIREISYRLYFNPAYVIETKKPFTSFLQLSLITHNNYPLTVEQRLSLVS